MGSDISPFFVNLYLFYCESEWIGKRKNIDHHRARRFRHVYRFIDDRITVNDNKKDANDNVATFLDLNIRIEEGQFSTKLYDKRDGFNFSIVRLPYKYSNIPSKIFYSTIFAESLRICRATFVQ